MEFAHVNPITVHSFTEVRTMVSQDSSKAQGHGNATCVFCRLGGFFSLLKPTPPKSPHEKSC